MSNKRASRIASRLMSVLSVLLAAVSIPAPVNATTQTDLVGPTGSGKFGLSVKVLPNGNIIVSDPYYDAGAILDVGAVYLYNGATLALISTLTGSTRGDAVGGWGVWVLSNGNFVVSSPNWHNGAVAGAGAFTWCSGTSGCSGPVTTTNSLVGTQEGDGMSPNDVLALSNGNYVVSQPFWHNGAVANAGAVTLCSGTGGCSGPVTTANSLVGTQSGDGFNGTRVMPLYNGNYVVGNPYWTNGAVAGAGAATWCSGTSGCSGPVTMANSLVGTLANDHVGDSAGSGSGVMPLSNGNYVIISKTWDNGAVTDAGAVTWCSGTGGCSGPVTTINSLVGAQTNDTVGWDGLLLLSNGNYVVPSASWDNGTVKNAGAVTWCSGISGCSGLVTTINSLVGTQLGDNVGYGHLLALSNGNYVVPSASWHNDTVTGAGAVTWCNGTSGCTGPVTTTNSLVGTQAGDGVGDGGTWAFSNGNYVVSSWRWANGAAAQAGAATWCSGMSGCTGPVTPTNSLVGTQANDQVGNSFVTALSNGNYVVGSSYWDNGAVTDAGAVTWCSGTSGCTSAVTTANSLTGTQTNDQVGFMSASALSNGNYVVISSRWANGSAAQAGAVTLCSGTSGCSGPVTTTNSLVGTQAGDQAGSGHVSPLSNGNYVVGSPYWANGTVVKAGAVTWCSGTSGCNSTVTTTNSLVGTQANDQVGGWGVRALSNGNYVATSQYWDNGAVTDAGAITWGDGASGTTTGPLTDQNSVLGEAVYGGNMNFTYDGYSGHLVVGRPAENKVTVVFLVSNTYIYLPFVIK